MNNTNTVFIIETHYFEDYGNCVKAKGTRRIRVECDYIEEAREVAEMFSDNMEFVVDVYTVNANILAEEDMVFAEMEAYAPTRTVPTVVRRGNYSSDWYLKRGYVVNSNEDRPEFKHLAGKFCGWVDNLSIGKCVLKIQGDKRIPMEMAL